MSNAELRIDATTVDEPGSDSRWNRNGCATSGLITSIRKEVACDPGHILM